MRTERGLKFEDKGLRPGPLLLSAALGGLSGARCASGPALVAWSDRERGLPRPLVAASLAFACFEVVADKTPWIGDRISPSQLAMRVVSGALAGGAVAARFGRSRTGPALLGAAAAVGAAFATFVLRREAGKRLGWKAGVAEDAAVYGLGRLALAGLERAA